MQEMNTKKKILFDCILILALLTVALSAFFILRASSGVGSYVRVSVGGEVVGQYPLSVDGEFEINGGTNILKIEGGRACMIYGNCNENPSMKCTSQGWIERELEIISCLPNEVFLEIVE